LLDNGSLGTVPQQWINTWKPDRCYDLTHVPVSTDKQQMFSMVTGDYISGRAEKNAFINSSLVIHP
jgi:hypothetical protein